MEVTLVMFKADGTRRDFPLKKDRVVIGRTGSCDLRIPLSSVSRRHCEIVREASGVRLRDLGSSNGTFHNSTRVTEILLSPSDEIGIGPVVFTVVIDGDPADIRPAQSASALSQDEEYEEAEQHAVPTGMPLEDDLSDDGITDEGEDEQYTPTVNLDDPVAALEALSSSESEPEYDMGESGVEEAEEDDLGFGDDDASGGFASYGSDEAADDDRDEDAAEDDLDATRDDDDDDFLDASDLPIVADDDADDEEEEDENESR